MSYERSGALVFFIRTGICFIRIRLQLHTKEVKIKILIHVIVIVMLSFFCLFVCFVFSVTLESSRAKKFEEIKKMFKKHMGISKMRK